MQQQMRSKPWYCYFWVWFFISIIGLAVVACSITVYLVIKNPDHIVDSHWDRTNFSVLETDE